MKKLNGEYYLFDCLGIVYDSRTTGLPSNLTPVNTYKDDKEAKRDAMNYEASLYKNTYVNGELIDNKMLYEPYFW